MSAFDHLFSSESVTAGHPDKLCDRISDAVLDAHLARDPNARVACEVMAAGSMIIIAGEISSQHALSDRQLQELARDVVRDVGYDNPDRGFCADTCKVQVLVNAQSPDIAQGVDDAYEHRLDATDTDPYDMVGAGDQGIMFGFACDETVERMPLAIMLAHALTNQLTRARQQGLIDYLGPDGKAQVTLRYTKRREDIMHPHVVGIDTIIVSTQHDDGIDHAQLTHDIVEHVVRPVLDERLTGALEQIKQHELLANPTKEQIKQRIGQAYIRVLVNPTGKFVVGGPVADAGLTGRKIIVDTYGGSARHGGGAFSGKDATKVDRSAAYAARHVARNLVAAGLTRKCEVQLAYAIGVAHPVSVLVLDELGQRSAYLERAVREVFDLRPAAIIERLGLRRPIYQPLTSGGHFGRTDLDVGWERENYVDALCDWVTRSSARDAKALGF